MTPSVKSVIAGIVLGLILLIVGVPWWAVGMVSWCWQSGSRRPRTCRSTPRSAAGYREIRRRQALR